MRFVLRSTNTLLLLEINKLEARQVKRREHAAALQKLIETKDLELRNLRATASRTPEGDGSLGN